MIKIKRGLDLPISGQPTQSIEDAKPARSVAVVGYDYHGLKPTMEVQVGDRVKKGQLIFTDKKNVGVKYTAPASGTVTAVNRGKKRVFQSLVIDVEGSEEETFPTLDPASASRDDLVKLLVDSGEWVGIRTRPFNKVPAVDSAPADIFVSIMDTRPLAADPSLVLAEQSAAFNKGLDALALLTDGKIYVCGTPDASISISNSSVSKESFAGPHPAGLVGTHIHFLSPVHQNKTVWHVGYQDVIAIGHLCETGKIYSERVISLAGPGVEKPRLLRTQAGVSLEELTAGELNGDTNRVVSGSVLDGRTAEGPLAFLGRYDNQVSVLREGTDREFLGFVMPGTEKFSLTNLFIASLMGKKLRPLTTNTGGSSRAMVPLGTFEEVMPLDVLPTQLLRALLVSDVDSSIQLGCLELDEEDLALCTFACPGKYEYGPYLREMLTTIEAEG